VAAAVQLGLTMDVAFAMVAYFTCEVDVEAREVLGMVGKGRMGKQ
jgi:hypothetical protein